MINRVALFVASLAAALTLAVGLAVAGFTPGAPAAATIVVQDAAATTTDPSPTIQVDTVYLAPDPTPENVTITKVVAAKHQDDEGEGESD